MKRITRYSNKKFSEKFLYLRDRNSKEVKVLVRSYKSLSIGQSDSLSNKNSKRTTSRPKFQKKAYNTDHIANSVAEFIFEHPKTFFCAIPVTMSIICESFCDEFIINHGGNLFVLFGGVPLIIGLKGTVRYHQNRNISKYGVILILVSYVVVLFVTSFIIVHTITQEIIIPAMKYKSLELLVNGPKK